MSIASFNQSNPEEVKKALLSCCTSQKWATKLMSSFPFQSEKDITDRALSIWYDECGPEDYLEAFAHHPQIGDVQSLQVKFAGNEQAGISAATNEIIETLSEKNKAYQNKFGFIFIVCATGRSAEEMLNLLQDRLKNTREVEIQIAMGEQMKITILRLQKIIPSADWNFLKTSQITTHVLDTSIGKPGQNISIRLQMTGLNGWQTIAQGITNPDGRLTDLLPPNRILDAGNYNIVFDTDVYFKTQDIKGFYPEVNIQFTVSDDAHYHVPLLINPFGYSTYRGS